MPNEAGDGDGCVNKKKKIICFVIGLKMEDEYLAQPLIPRIVRRITQDA